MSEDDGLTLTSSLYDFLIENIIHDNLLLDSFFLSDSNELLLERYRSIRIIKIEKSFVYVDSTKHGHVFTVRQSGT
jgi:hypothetical protein